MRRAITLISLAAVVIVAAILSAVPSAPVSAQFTPLVTASATPVFQGTFVTASPTAEFCITPLPLTQGDILLVTGGVIIRYGPTASSPYLAQYDTPREFVIVDGPVCNGGLTWWGISGQGITGWVSEGRGTRYWVRPLTTGGGRTECPAALKLVTGEGITLTGNVRLRAAPGLTNYTLTVAPAGSRVTVLEGPQCANDINWWKVRATVLDVVYDGWMAENEPTGDLLVAVTPAGDGTICDFPLNMRIGDRARVMYRDSSPKRLRNMPDLDGAVLADLVENVPLEIIGGPLCADTYNWWQVRVLTSNPVVGWMAEGGPANYWIAPVIRATQPATYTPTPFYPTYTPTFSS